MSKIVVLIESTDAHAIKSVRDATGTSFSDVVNRVKSHRPAAEFRLFFNDHDEVAARLRRLMSEFRSSGIVAQFFELSPDEEYETTKDLDACRMTPEVVENTLKSHEREIQRMKREDDQLH